MEVQFAHPDLRRLENEVDFTAGLPEGAVKGFRRVVQAIRSAKDERDLYAMRSFRFEKLKGDRSHQRSLRPNDQWRLVVEIIPGKPKNKMRLIAIEDYH